MSLARVMDHMAGRSCAACMMASTHMLISQHCPQHCNQVHPGTLQCTALHLLDYRMQTVNVHRAQHGQADQLTTAALDDASWWISLLAQTVVFPLLFF